MARKNSADSALKPNDRKRKKAQSVTKDTGCFNLEVGNAIGDGVLKKVMTIKEKQRNGTARNKKGKHDDNHTFSYFGFIGVPAGCRVFSAVASFL